MESEETVLKLALASWKRVKYIFFFWSEKYEYWTFDNNNKMRYSTLCHSQHKLNCRNFSVNFIQHRLTKRAQGPFQTCIIHT